MLYFIQCKSIAKWLNLQCFYNILVKYTTVVFGIFSLWNKVSSTKWKLLTKEQQQEYNEKATRAESQTMSQKKEMRRVLSNLSNLVCKTIHLNSVLNVDAVCRLLYILYCLGWTH